MSTDIWLEIGRILVEGFLVGFAFRMGKQSGRFDIRVEAIQRSFGNWEMQKDRVIGFRWNGDWKGTP